jgi:prolyl oligopeptidase
VDSYFGTKVADPYRWLENGEDPQVKAWNAAQNARTRAYLDGLPERSRIRAELSRLIKSSSVSFTQLSARGGRVFAIFFDPARQQPMLVVLNAAADPASRKILLDPNTMDPAGHTAITWWVASPDGSRVAVALSKNGSELGELKIYRVDTGAPEGPPIPDVQYPTAGGSLAWAADGKGFWYTRYPGASAPQGERHFNMQVYFHSLGTDWHGDTLALGTKDGLTRISEIFLDNRYARPAIVAVVANGDGGAFSHYLLRPGAPPLRLCQDADAIAEAVMGPDDAIYAVSREAALNGKILRLAAPYTDASLARAPVVVPESANAIRSDGTLDGKPAMVFAGGLMFVRYMAGGNTQVLAFAPDGTPAGRIALPGIAEIDEADPLDDGSVLFRVSTYLRPPYFARWSPATKAVTETALAETSAAHFDDAQLRQEFAISKDGTRIPITIITRKDIRLDGHNPTVLYGYGGFGISMTPVFAGAPTRLWLDAGGVFAIANIRGGSEFGERWHQDGKLLKKQNAFDDFAAAAQHLIDAQYTTSSRLAFFGESNGGLLMGAVTTQHPGLARAVVSRVGIYDMLRLERDPNGAFNTTEYGSVSNPQQFRALYAYSPYHHVTPGVAYPAMLLTAGENDGRVNPLNSRKFAAALQAATTSPLPVLLSTSANAGHGMGDPLDTRIDTEADIQVFLLDQLRARQ